MHASEHQVTLRFADGVEQVVPVGPCASVLEAALAHGVPLLHQCQSGSCSSCTAHLTLGHAGTRQGMTTALLASEYESGQRLLCATQPHTDCTFELAYNSTASASVAEVQAFVDSVERIASDVVRLTLELADQQWLDFRPGQYLQVTVPGLGALRSYSPSSTAVELPRLQMLIRLQPGGAMSNWLLNEARPDDVLTLQGPYGAFFLQENRRAPHLFVAGGTGLAPILSMIDGIRQWPGRKPPVLLSFGCAHPDALFGLDEIELRQQWMPSLRSRVCVDKGAHGGLLAGNPVSVLNPEDVTPDTVAYLCGPPRMIKAARERLLSFGVPAEHIHSELFTPSH